MEAASRTLTPVVLELGGKDAFIVCDDADVTEANPLSSSCLILCSDCCLQVAPIAVRGALQSSGQNCAGAERFYVQEPVYEKFVKEVSSIVKSVRMVSFDNSLLSWVL
jgi:acyl-CoA reductase-like NAD-dependent aldehyde dehydrogenase